MTSGIKHLYSYKDLFLVLLWRDFNIRYKQAVLGIAWAIIQPLSMMFLFTFIFTYVMPMKISDVPRPVFFFSGLLPWTFFSSTMNGAIPSLVNNYDLIKSIYFPRVFLPLSSLAIAITDFFLSLLIFIGLLLFFKIKITLTALWIIPLFLLLFLFTVSIALVLSALNVYYRDVGLASTFLIQLLFFASPIFYSIDKISPKAKLILFLNPLTFIIENMRRCLIEGRPTLLWQYLIMLAFVTILFVLSYQFFRRTERKFADVI